jgi:nucleoside-diphosphate-sugar epimerase
VTASQGPPVDRGDETVLVTGANGFVGLNLLDQLTRRGVRVLAGTRRPPDMDAEPAHHHLVEWIPCDVTNRKHLVELVRTRGVTRILHAAAVTPTPEIEANDPVRVVDVNLVGTVNTLEAARLGRVDRFLLVSSSVLYRGFPADRGRARETDALLPDNLYGVCKDACENLCRQYRRCNGVSAVSARLGTAYGPWEKESLSRSRLSAVTQLMAMGTQDRDRPLRVHGLEVARDYIHVSDACAAIAELTMHPNPGWDVYNVSSDAAFTLREALMAITAETPGFDWVWAEHPDTADFAFAEADVRAPLDLSRLRSDVPQWELRDLRRGIADYAAWRRSQSE